MMMIRELLAISVLLTATAAAFAQKPMPVDNFKAIYAGAAPSPMETKAATELQQGIQRLYGAQLPVVDSLKALPAGQAAFVLGRAAVLESRLVTEKDLARTKRGGYLIRSAGGRIAIAGDDVWATYFGVLGFLEKLGMRFYLPDSTKAYVPKVSARTIPPISALDRPVLFFRNGWSPVYRQTMPATGDPRKGLNPELYTAKTGSDQWIDHSAGYLVPRLLYCDTHPEYYAMDKDGKRASKDSFTDHRTPLCLSNPEVTRIATERALAWVGMNPEQRFFTITYGDTGLWCQCPECLKLDPAPGEYATRVLHWVNPLARAIREKYPDKTVLTLAYGGSDRVPPKARPEKNVAVICATGSGCYPFWDHSFAQTGTDTKKIEAWAKVAPGQVMVCEYLGDYEPAMVDKMTGRLRYYQKIGVQGIWATYGAPVNFRPVWEYVWSKMCWNPQQDGQALAKEFIRFYYGPAAEPILRFFELSHERYRATLASREKVGARFYPPSYYSTEFAQQAMACFAEAEKAAADARLSKDLAAEERLFLSDWMQHPAPPKPGADAKALVLIQLNRLLLLAGQSDKERMEFARAVYRVGISMDSVMPGSREWVETWVRNQNFPMPGCIALPDGVRIPPEAFMFGGFGPEQYREGCPPRTCVGVYVRGNSMNRSDRMEAAFDLGAISGDGRAKLTLEGQDSDKDVPAARIELLINGKSIFKGDVTFVKHNWSRQTFDVPPGVLVKGANKLEVVNVGDPKSLKTWSERWALISDAVVKFQP